MATDMGSYTPAEIDMLPISPALKAAWKAKYAPVAPDAMSAPPPPAPPPPAPSGPAVPPLMAALSPGAAAQWNAAPPAVTSSLMAPPPPASTNVDGSVSGPAWTIDAKGNVVPTAGAGSGMPAPTAPEQMMSKPAEPLMSLPPGAALVNKQGPAPMTAASDSAPGFGGGGGGFAPPPSMNPTGYGQPAPVGDPLAAKKAAVLLPGQDAQFQHEMAFGASQNAKDAELLGIKATAQEKMAAEQAGATEAYAQAQAQEVKDRENFAAFYDGENQKLQATSDRLANAKVDSMRMFKQEGLAGVFQAVSVAFAMYAGVKGAAATGGQNAGVIALEKAIDRDVAAQEKDLQRQEAGLARSNSLLAQKYRVFGDMQMAKAAAKMDAWKLASMRADVIAQQSGADAAKVGAAKMKEAADRGLMREQENWNIGIEAKYKQFQLQQAQAAAAAAGAQQAKMDEERKFWRDKNATVLLKGAEEITKGGGIPKLVPVTKVDPDTGKSYAAYTLVDVKTGKEFTDVPNGGANGAKAINMPVMQEDGTLAYKQVIPYGKEGAAKMQEKAAGATGAIKAIDAMEEAANMPGPWTGEKLMKYKQAQANYATAYGQAKGLGALAESDLALVYKTIPDAPTWGVGYLSEAQRAQLKSQKQQFSKDLNELGTVYGQPGAGNAAITMTPAGGK